MTRGRPAAPTLPPPPAEAAALAAFESALRREGEPRARLRHLASHASATLRGVTLPPANVMGAKVARRVQSKGT